MCLSWNEKLSSITNIVSNSDFPRQTKTLNSKRNEGPYIWSALKKRTLRMMLWDHLNHEPSQALAQPNPNRARIRQIKIAESETGKMKIEQSIWFEWIFRVGTKMYRQCQEWDWFGFTRFAFPSNTCGKQWELICNETLRVYKLTKYNWNWTLNEY